MKIRIYISTLIVLFAMIGCENEVEIPVSTAPPTVNLVGEDVAVANGKYIVTAEGRSAYGGAQLSKVEFYKGEDKIGEKAIAPYTFEYDVTGATPGQELSFHAVLVDRAGNRAKSNVVNPIVSRQPAPAITLSGEEIATSGEKYTLRADVRIATGGAQIAKVEFYKGEDKIGEKTATPYTFEYDVTETVVDQQLSFHAVVTDFADNLVKSNVINPIVKILPPVRIEAENATMRGLAKVARNEWTVGASNGAKVGGIDNADSGIDAVIEIPSSGEYKITVAAGTGLGATHRIYVDDKVDEAKTYNIPNQGWDNWQRFDMVFYLEAGTRKISIRRVSGFGELDYLEYSKL